MWTVYLKDLRELLRDFKTIVFTVLIPVIALPLIATGFVFVASKLADKAGSADIKYALVGAQHSPGLSARFGAVKSFREVKLDAGTSYAAAIADERVKFVLVIPPGFEDAVGSNRQASVTLHFNGAESGDVTRRRVSRVIDDYNDTAREKRLPSLRIDKSELAFVLNPIRIEERSTANERERIGAVVGGMLPYILLLVCLLAAMFPAIELAAGEKENGTLETLLLAPIPRTELVMGKFMVLFSVGLTSAILMIGSLGVLFGMFGEALGPQMAAVASSLGVLDLSMLALMLVPTAAIFASVLLSLSIYAKSYKEASGWMQPMIVVAIMPVMLAVVPGVQLDWIWAAVPLTNIALAMKEVVKGTLDYRMLLMILLSTSFVAGVLLAWCRWWFNREEVLFRN